MLERIAKVCKAFIENDELVITEQTIFSELELDSLDMVELVMNIEEEFGVTIEMNEAIKSVGDLMKILQNAK